MFKIYSKGCEYALRILAQISVKTPEEKFLAAKLCRKAKVPIHSARKVLQMLVEKNILSAVSGPGGGYKLRVDPSQISLFDVISAIEGQDVYDQCVMGLDRCNSMNPCPLHHMWQGVKEEMKNEMGNKKLVDLMAKSERFRL